jgi:hypothetical protein
MHALLHSPSLPEAAASWAARGLAAFLVGLVLLIGVGTGGFNPLAFSPIEAVQMGLFLTACAGLVAGWRWPVVGGGLATAATALFYAVEAVVTGAFPRGAVFPLFLVAGVLFLVSGLLRRRRPAG